jgi:hypothetical protein
VIVTKYNDRRTSPQDCHARMQHAESAPNDGHTAAQAGIHCFGCVDDTGDGLYKGTFFKAQVIGQFMQKLCGKENGPTVGGSNTIPAMPTGRRPTIWIGSTD